MPYPLSASRLQTYDRCAKSYYFKYERRIEAPGVFGSTALGMVLHQTLEKFYRDWSYDARHPELQWMEHCWNQYQQKLTDGQRQEGWQILQNYYDRHVADTDMRKPLAIEGRIQAAMSFENIEFNITGRYDRLDFVEDGLEVIDYKSTKDIKPPHPDDVDLQIGLYYLTLEQIYGQSLKRLSLLYLRNGEKYTFEATSEHRFVAEAVIGALAAQIRNDGEWDAMTGNHCKKCNFARYCSAVTDEPLPLPEDTRPRRGLQLTLSI